ncbi:MAG: SUMF1/EgtB/PvdO family nonheme iron enzyme [Prochloraceae cyanobacterium]|nr:SUMF1/EgtB/PvdO family nonheme iron enzyme [Prochloraceae cyanobacterium]
MLEVEGKQVNRQCYERRSQSVGGWRLRECQILVKLSQFSHSLEMIQQTPQLNSFNFVVITVNEKGEQINTSHKVAQYYTEDLGNGVTLNLVAIPGGQFMMGAPKGEKYSKASQRPQHCVTIQPFFMGQFPVTQAQWKAIALGPKVDRDLTNF